MALTPDDLQAIGALLDTKLQPINDRLETLEIKHDVTSRKLDDINFRLASLEYTSKKEFSKISDEIDTLIAVLEAKDILPKQA